MTYKDRDIRKLKKYANKLGLKVYTKSYNKDTGSAEYVSGKYITLFVNKYTTKNDMILSLLHELGHHLDWLEKSTSKEELIAFEYLAQGSMVGSRKDIPKKYRRRIFLSEKSGIKYMSKIHALLDLSIPFYKVKQQEDMDILQYEFLYKKGRFITNIEATKHIYKKVDFYKRKYGRQKSW